MNWNALSNAAIVQEMGNRLRQYRFKRQLAQHALAEQAGISPFTVAQ